VLVSALAVLAGLLTAGIGRLPGQFSGRFAPGRRVTGAIVGGAVTTVGAVVIAEWAYQQVTAELLRRFPMEIEDGVRDLSTTVADSFGESTVLLLAVLVCVGVVTVLLLGLRLALWSGLLSGTSPGASLAAGGLFLAVAFGATVGAPAWLVVGGVTACLLVRDAGQFGATLVREVGVGQARRVEFVHLAGTVLVGLGAATLALLVVGRVPAPTGTATGTDLLALASLVVGLVSLVLALALRWRGQYRLPFVLGAPSPGSTAGTATRSNTSLTTVSGVVRRTLASVRNTSRCANTGTASRLMSSGTT
jgi:hypothetical protein